MKRHMRKEMKAALAAMPPEEAAAKSLAACSAIESLPEFALAGSVMLYNPIPAEVDCVHLALTAWQREKVVLLPKVTWEQRHMIAVQCFSLADEMVPSRYGIQEPAAGQPWPLEDIDFIVVPALAFDRKGNRLGRGGGFYDRFLAQPRRRAVACGVAFSRQVVDELPVQANDCPVEILVTDTEVLRFARPE